MDFALAYLAGVASTITGLVLHEAYKSWRKRRIEQSVAR